MKSAKTILKEVQEEYKERIEKDGAKNHPLHYLALFNIDKYYTEEQKHTCCKELIVELLDTFQSLQDELIDNKKEIIQSDVEEYRIKTKPLYDVFAYAIPPCAQVIEEEELIKLFSSFDGEQRFGEYIKKQNSMPASRLKSLFEYFGYLTDLVIFYQNKNGLSQNLKEGLENLKKVPSVKMRNFKLSKIDDILNGKGHISIFHLHHNRILESAAITITNDKKWTWLNEHKLTFIDDKTVFFKAVENLSGLNYFNIPSISEGIFSDLKKIDSQKYEEFILDILEFTKKEGRKRSTWFIGEKVIAFRIFVWILFYHKSKNRYSLAIKLAEKCFTKIPRVGPTSRKLGDTILKLLSEEQTIEGLGALLTLKSRNKYPVFREALDTHIANATSYTKLNPSDVEDYFIEDYGLKDGGVEHSFAGFKSRIEVLDFNNVKMHWYKENGTMQKSVPAKVKSDFAGELKLWKAKFRDIKKDLSGQKQRIEGFLSKRKCWSFERWKKYILEHQLLRLLSQKLIWQFSKDDLVFCGIYLNGVIVDENGIPLKVDKEAEVRLWHPVYSSVEEIQNWREFLMEKEIKQPFKQAFREVYLVTDAEVATETYSNRFLNHIVRHHKFVALAKQRLWKYDSVFSHEWPTILYEDFNLKIQFDINSDYELATTGRVHFHHSKSGQAVHVNAVPPIVFSEVMRDVDLFVGVCSIGIEEEWNQRQHVTYWRNYSSSDLSEMAKTRKSLLTNMIPKLKIAPQCEIKDKFLVVKGKIKTYKIHLGSGNILMEPNDQYLCIVPSNRKESASAKLFLPFDDDALFSIILSKAFLLAEDDKIKDPVILNQLKK